jgi:hypothetical protein
VRDSRATPEKHSFRPIKHWSKAVLRASARQLQWILKRTAHDGDGTIRLTSADPPKAALELTYGDLHFVPSSRDMAFRLRGLTEIKNAEFEVDYK